MSWYELLIEGPEESVKEILARGRKEGERPYLGSELEIDACSFPERVLDFLQERTHQLVYVPASLVRGLIHAIEETREIRLEHLCEVLSVSFSFEAEAYSRDMGDKIRETVHNDLPPGVRLEGFEEVELRDAEAKGVELYSPVHDYTYTASGCFTGTPPGIFELHQRMREIDFVRQDELELETRQVDPAGL